MEKFSEAATDNVVYNAPLKLCPRGYSVSKNLTLLAGLLICLAATAPTVFAQAGSDVLTVDPAFDKSEKAASVAPTTISDGDHPLISRFPGAQDFESLRLDYDSASFPSKTTKSFMYPDLMYLKGDVYSAAYRVESTSPAAIIENYKRAFEKAGFSIELECLPETCEHNYNAGSTAGLFNDKYTFNGKKPQYVTAHRGGVYAGVFSSSSNNFSYVSLKIVDTNQSSGQLLTVDVNALKKKDVADAVPSVFQEGDHPLLSRYPGAEQFHHTQTDYEEVQFFSGETKDFIKPVTFPLKGDVYRAVYVVPGASSLKILENYKRALAASGFELTGECTPTTCENANSAFTTEILLVSDVSPFKAHKPYIMTARKDGVHVAVFTNQRDEKSYVKLMIVETEELGAQLVTTNASEIGRKIDQDGKAAIYGIYFDTGKAEVKPESRKTLDAMAEYLETHPGLNFYVVGHTDDTGELEANVQLSTARAQAVATNMAEHYKVDAKRLLAKGVGPYSPEGSNLTGKGKSENRRVELVLRLSEK